MPWPATHSRVDTRHAVYQHATFSYSYPPFLKTPYTRAHKIQTPQTLACGVCILSRILITLQQRGVRVLPQASHQLLLLYSYHLPR